MQLDSSLVIICGHYGTGKTNFTLNLARDLRGQGREVTIADMDVVNPYFRSSDYSDLLKEWGVSLIAPRFARSNVDIPALPAEIHSIFAHPDQTILIDAGGDDAGATALGRLAGQIAENGYEMLYVINHYRPLAGEEQDASVLLREIEAASRLKATAIVNNSHLQSQTTAQTVLDALPFAEQTARALGLPIVANAVPRAMAEQLKGKVDALFPVDVLVTTPWQELVT